MGNLTSSTPIANANSNQLLIVGVTANASYYCNVTNTDGTVPSRVAKLVVQGKLPTITCSRAPSMKLNMPFTLTANATSTGALTYQWFLNNTSLSKATNATYVVAKALKTSAGNYTVRITTSSYGNLTSKPFQIIVWYPPSITTQPSSTSVMAGSSAQFQVVVAGSPAPTFQWYVHNRAITNRPSATTARLNLATVHIPDANIYRVRVMNSQGFVYSNYANLTVTPFNGGGSGTSGNTSGGNTTN